jgi:hypothetical protein
VPRPFRAFCGKGGTPRVHSRLFPARYFLEEQSPGQHAEPGWQQLIPQQEPEQHFEPGLQQFPVKAIADNDDSDSTTRANSLYLIWVSSRFEHT